VRYFAYGSNLDEEQMRARCPSAVVEGPAMLPNHTLVFGGFSHRWGGAVASIVRARGVAVPGLVYTLEGDDVARLDRIEGHPFAYERVARFVVVEGRRRRVQTYVQPEGTFETWAPPAAYLAVIARAYRRLGFDRVQLAVAAGLGGVG